MLSVVLNFLKECAKRFCTFAIELPAFWIQRRLAALCAGACHAIQLGAEVKRELDGTAAGIRVVANPASDKTPP